MKKLILLLIAVCLLLTYYTFAYNKNNFINEKSDTLVLKYDSGQYNITHIKNNKFFFHKANTAKNKINIDVDNIYLIDSSEVLYSKYSFGFEKSNLYNRVKGDFTTNNRVLFYLPIDGNYNLIIYNNVLNLRNDFFINKSYLNNPDIINRNKSYKFVRPKENGK